MAIAALEIAVAALRSIPHMVVTTLRFLLLLAYFVVLGGTYRNCTILNETLHARVHVYSLALVFRIWSWPHYRNGTFQEDMRKNLRNVALPGTGVPLSVFCCFRVTALFFVLCVYPAVCAVAAVVRRYKEGSGNIAELYREQLLTPSDWFSFWSLNCRLASYHAAVTGAGDYDMESKWRFLQEAERRGVAVSPWISDFDELVVKDKNEEGGMGIHFFKSATHGGDWVIQRRLRNSEKVSRMLPPDAPLSTIRVITGSKLAHGDCAVSDAKKQQGGGGSGSGRGRQVHEHDASVQSSGASPVMVFSSVFRAGRAGANTDHSSILFDVDADTGRLKAGTTNAHWYCLGPAACLTTPMYSFHDTTAHPDTRQELVGEHLADMRDVHRLVREAHLKLIPHVAMAGWDVALTPSGALLLEVNLSCNFFRGTFDLDEYIQFVHTCFCFLEYVEECNAGKK